MSSRTKRFAMLALAVAFLVGAGLLVQPLHGMQAQYDLVSAPLKGVSPEVALATTALGVFRGIIVDIVWIRMENLKDEGKVFEIVQLADLACKLAPRMPDVWDFNAWNMAYNVSVQLHDLTERWLWVKQGIEVLRDEGIPRNPREPKLYYRLAWIYLHKIGERLDDAHWHYKQQFALEMHEVLPGGGPRTQLEELARAPGTEEELLNDPEVMEFYERCLQQGFDPLDRTGDEGLLGFFLWLRSPDSIGPSARLLMEAEENRDAVARIAAYARARRLEKLKLEPDKMIDLVDQYGPLDWRTPYPHAIYWATIGKAVAHGYRARVDRRRKEYGQEGPEKPEWDVGVTEFEYGEINHDRAIYGALKELVTGGRLVFDPDGRLVPIMGPDYRFANAMIETYERIVEVYGDSERFSSGVLAAYKHFLTEVAIAFYFRGEDEKSRGYYRRLQENYSNYRDPYEQFIRKEVLKTLQTLGPEQCRSIVSGLLFQGYYYLSAGATDRAHEYVTMAKRRLKLWNQTQPERVTRQLSFDIVNESVLMDIFAGRSPLGPREVADLKEVLPEDVVRRLEDALRRKVEPKPFDLDGKQEPGPE